MKSLIFFSSLNAWSEVMALMQSRIENVRETHKNRVCFFTFQTSSLNRITCERRIADSTPNTNKSSALFGENEIYR